MLKYTGLIILFLVIIVSVGVLISPGHLCELERGSRLRSECFFDIAVKNNDTSLCERSFIPTITREGYINNCYATIATTLNEESICNSIKNEDGFNLCLGRVKRSSLYCDKISNSKDKTTCYLYAMGKYNDPKICKTFEEADTGHLTDFCYDDIIHLYNDKQFLPEYNYSNESGIKIYAILNNDTNMCELLTETYNRDNCYFKIAISNDDVQTCDNIEKDSDRDTCKAIISKDIEACSEITTMTKWNNSYNDKCYQNMAYKTLDPELCNNLAGAHSIPPCIREVAKLANDINICDTRHNSWGKKVLWRSHQILCQAIVSKDTSYCENLPISNQKFYCGNCEYDEYSYCMFEVSKLSDDVEICGKIRWVGPRDVCYKNMAMKHNNIQICDNIERPSFKELCQKEVQ